VTWKNLRLHLTDKQKCLARRGLSKNNEINVSDRMSALAFHSQFLERMDGCWSGPMDGWMDGWLGVD